MNHEFSAGIVVYCENKQRCYLLLHYSSGHWDFPKGHIEQQESKEIAARRELQEETGITSVELIPGFIEEFTYFFRNPQGQLIKKTVYFFAGKTNQKEVVLSDEHIGYEWLPFNDAIERLTYQNAKNLLSTVEQFLNKKGPRFS